MARMIKSSLLVVSLIALVAPCGLLAQGSGGKGPSADLITPLAKELSASPKVAEGAAGSLFGLASAASAFSALGLKPELVAKAIPILTQYVGKMGGPALASLLGGVLK